MISYIVVKLIGIKILEIKINVIIILNLQGESRFYILFNLHAVGAFDDGREVSVFMYVACIFSFNFGIFSISDGLCARKLQQRLKTKRIASKNPPFIL